MCEESGVHVGGVPQRTPAHPPVHARTHARTWVGLDVGVDESLEAEAGVDGEETDAGVQRVALDVVRHL